MRLVDSVGEIRTICSAEEGVGFPDANLFGPINTPGAGVPSHPRMQPVKLSKCSEGVFVFKYTVKTAGLCVLEKGKIVTTTLRLTPRLLQVPSAAVSRQNRRRRVAVSCAHPPPSPVLFLRVCYRCACDLRVSMIVRFETMNLFCLLNPLHVTFGVGCLRGDVSDRHRCSGAGTCLADGKCQCNDGRAGGSCELQCPGEQGMRDV